MGRTRVPLSRSIAGVAIICLIGTLVACDRPLSLQPAPEESSVSAALRFQVLDGRIVDQHGRIAILRGLNVSGTWKNVKGHLGVHTEQDFQNIASYGFTVLRLLTFWSAIMPQEGQIDHGYLDKLALRVEWARKAGMYIFVDMHQDVYGPGFGFNGAPIWTCEQKFYDMLTEPPVPWFAGYDNSGVQACYDNLWGSEKLQNYYRDAWVAVIDRLKEYDNVIGVDLMNEPYWGSHDLKEFEPERLWVLYQRVLPALRQIRPGLLFFMEPSASKNVLGVSWLPREGFPGTVYTPHLYHPAMEIGGAYKNLKPYFSRRMEADQKEADEFGTPLFIGEWGSYGSQADYTDFLRDFLALTNKHLIGWTYWESGPANSYGLHDPKMQVNSWGPSLMEPYPHLIAGKSPQFVRDGDRYTLSYTALEDLKQTTVIAVPSWRAPKGLTILEKTNIETAQQAGHTLILTHLQAGQSTRIVFQITR